MASRKPKLGRPPIQDDDRRIHTLKVKANDRERQKIASLAKINEQSVSEYLRERGMAS